MRPYIIGACAGSLLALVVGWVGWTYVPAWQAGRLYAQIPSYDHDARCDAATHAADAWAAAGNYQRSTEWRDEGAASCAMARLNASIERGA